MSGSRFLSTLFSPPKFCAESPNKSRLKTHIAPVFQWSKKSVPQDQRRRLFALSICPFDQKRLCSGLEPQSTKAGARHQPLSASWCFTKKKCQSPSAMFSYERNCHSDSFIVRYLPPTFTDKDARTTAILIPFAD